MHRRSFLADSLAILPGLAMMPAQAEAQRTSVTTAGGEVADSWVLLVLADETYNVILLYNNGEPYHDLVISPFILGKLRAAGHKVTEGRGPRTSPVLIIDILRISVGSIYCFTVRCLFQCPVPVHSNSGAGIPADMILWYSQAALVSTNSLVADMKEAIGVELDDFLKTYQGARKLHIQK